MYWCQSSTAPMTKVPPTHGLTDNKVLASGARAGVNCISFLCNEWIADAALILRIDGLAYHLPPRLSLIHPIIITHTGAGEIAPKNETAYSTPKVWWHLLATQCTSATEGQI